MRHLSAALALLLLTSPAIWADEVHDNETGYNCSNLNQLYETHNKKGRSLSIASKERTLVVEYGAHATSRAVAAILVITFKHRYGYRNVVMRRGERTLCDLATKLSRFNSANTTEVIIHVGAEWLGRNEACPAIQGCVDTSLGICNAAGFRLSVIGEAPAPVAARLHARLARNLTEDTNCLMARHWSFYQNNSALEQCIFLRSSDKKLAVLVPDEMSDHVALLRDHPDFAGLHFQNISERTVLHEPSNASSFLFLDYDMWSDGEGLGVVVVRAPRFDDTRALLVADMALLQLHAARVATLLNRVHLLRDQHVRTLLQSGSRALEAACGWAYNNYDFYNNWSTTIKPNIVILTYSCEDDQDRETYQNVSDVVLKVIRKDIRHKYQYAINEQHTYFNCSNRYGLDHILFSLARDELRWQRTAGLVGIGAGLEAGSAAARATETRLVLADVPPLRTDLGPTAFSVTGSLLPLVRATARFVTQQGWWRLAVIADATPSPLAKDFYQELVKHEENGRRLILRKIEVNTENETVIKEALNRLVAANARVFFINTEAEGARRVLCAAAELNLAAGARYAWLARVWRAPAPGQRLCLNNDAKSMRHFTVGYAWRGGDDSMLPNDTTSKEIRRKLDSVYEGRAWPPRTSAAADALVLLAYTTVEALKKLPKYYYDMHGETVSSTIYSASRHVSVSGVTQNLSQQEFVRARPLVFVHAWDSAAPVARLLAVWQADDAGNIPPVNSSAQSEAYKNETAPAPDDGHARCLTTRSEGLDGFEPRCHDAAWFCTLALALLTPAALCLARRARLAQLAQHRRTIQLQLMARSERTAAALADHLVQRSALELRHEIGAGHFGRVRFGLLRLPHRPPVAVAVKALRDDAAPAEESEFLREACALSALNHERIVRLAGVCAGDGPPLLLMEHAFFGDLRGYLRARRHLAERATDTSPDPECASVSATQLTRLGAQVADAVHYLSTRKVIHRDIRAANCLVTEQRNIKLADFGMARTTGALARDAEQKDDTPSEPSDYEYLCRRRGVFPVPWMAPESVAHGVFSRASDVWALGVLIVELASLGARPFGAWSAPRVLSHVRQGGHPPLPRDASYHTLEIAEMCWRSAPDTRPSAEAVRQYLEAHPTAIRAALRPACTEDAPEPASCDERDSAAADSGFGERDLGQVEWVTAHPHISTL